jgi:galactose-1-phosphate uridylyltransferase
VAEFRLDTLTGRWTLISPERQQRPVPSVPWPVRKKPFKPLLRKVFPIPGSKNQIEIHDNLYPPVAPWAGDLVRSSKSEREKLVGKGAVVLLKFKNDTATVDLTAPEQAVFAEAINSLYSQYHRESRLKMLAFFCNSGRAAGATVARPHHQFWALPIQSPADEQELTWLKSRAHCETCSLLKLKKFFVIQNRLALCVSRPAARVAGELLIIPRRHVRSFTQLTVEERFAMIQLLVSSHRLLGKKFRKLAYNEIWREWRTENKKVHFRIEILPRLGPLASLEHGHDLFVNAFVPEEIARDLRKLHS